MQILYKNLKGNLTMLDVESSNTVESVMSELQARRLVCGALSGLRLVLWRLAGLSCRLLTCFP